MTHIEVKAEFERKIEAAKERILASKHGNLLSAKSFLYYINDKLEEKDTYDEKEEISLVNSLLVFVCGAESDEDASYEISLLVDLKSGEVRNPDALENEFKAFDEELERFLAQASEAESAKALIQAEHERIDEAGKKIIAEVEASIAKLKKIGIIGGIVLLGFLIITMLIK